MRPADALSCFFFFFSSRRRHTRLQGDWSSDVCSSDLITSWVQVMLGQHILPRNYHPAVDLIPEAELNELVGGVRNVISTCVAAMPMHEQFIARYGQTAAQQAAERPATTRQGR